MRLRMCICLFLILIAEKLGKLAYMIDKDTAVEWLMKYKMK